MGNIIKELLHTLALTKEKILNQKITGYDNKGNLNPNYIKEYWGETKEEIEKNTLSSKHYLILWVPSVIFTFLQILFGSLMKVDMWYDHPITIITTIIMAFSWAFSILGATARKEKASAIRISIESKKREAEGEESRESRRAEREKYSIPNKYEAELKRQENEKKRLEELNKRFGIIFGELVFHKKIRKGMSIKAVIASWSNPKLKKNNLWYYPNKENRTLTLVSFDKDKVSSISNNKKPFELDMQKKELITLWGSPEKTKEKVYKTKTKERLYYFSRKTKRDTIAYGYEVNLEDDIVVGWNELE